MHNLDQLAAQIAQKIVNDASPKELENLATKALGVLQENGVYACFLYLLAREDKIGRTVIAQMRKLLNKTGISNEQNEDLKYAAALTADLPTLLLAKEALERMLIYARYGAKAAQQESKNKKQASAGDEAKGGAS